MKYYSSLWLCSLFSLLSMINAVDVVSSGPETCAIQAWVRAPDLDPGEIIPGQVRIKVKGPCNPISEYSLILRFKERVWAKIPKPGVVLPEEPQRPLILNYSGFTAEQKDEFNSVLGRGFARIHWQALKDPLWEEYAKKIKDPTMWAVAEEERVAFETRYKLSDGLLPQPETQSIHDFALLVPTTNHPPSSNDITPSYSTKGPKAERGHEHTYLYTVEIKFVNGTTIEVPAGRSSFNTVRPNSHHDNTSEVVSFMANFMELNQTGLDPTWTPMNISFNVDVTFPHGRQLEQGSKFCLVFSLNGEPQGVPDDDQASIVLRPPSVSLNRASKHRRMQTLFPMTNVPSEMLLSSVCHSQLSPTSNDSARRSHLRIRNKVGKSDWNKTTSVAFEIPEKAFPSFDMYYQSIEAKLHVILRLRYVPKHDPLLTNEDYPWTPIIQTRRLENPRYFQTFQKEIPVVIYPRARKPDFQTIHYLAPVARQPAFVDPCKVPELSKLSVQERDLLAPKSKPVVNKGTDRDEKVLRNKYNPQRSLYYVGDTWQRKVVDSGEGYSMNGPCSGPLYQNVEAQVGFAV